MCRRPVLVAAMKRQLKAGRMSCSRMFAVLGGVFIVVGPTPTRAQEAVTAFVNVSVIPMDRERVITGQTVVVRGHMITEMGPVAQVKVPAGATRIDGQGKFLMPGLADMHAHIPFTFFWTGDSSATARVKAQNRLLLYLANGVTTVRVMGYSGTVGLSLRAEVASGAILGPRMYVGVGPVDYVPPDSATQFLEAAMRAGYDFVKVHGESNHDSAVVAARRVGLPVAGHPVYEQYSAPGGIPWAIQAGLASVEHQIGLSTVADAKRHAAGLKRAGVWVCPTLVLNQRHSRARLWDDSTWLERRYHPTEKVEPTAEQLATMREEQQAIKVLHDSGVGLLLGTDDIGGGAPGFAVHRELESLVEAGLTPYEALLTGTRNVAAYFGTLDSTGTVAVGKRADLILLLANPLENVRHTGPPAGVMQGGRWFPRAALDSILTRLEGYSSIGP